MYIGNARAGLLIWDVSNPAEPKELGSCGTPGPAMGVYVHGQYAYVAAGEAGLRIIDVSNPASSNEVGSLDPPGSAKGVHVRFPFAYVADGSGGMRVIDISSPNHPQEVNSLFANTYIRNVSLYGNFAYVAADKVGLIILNVSNPSSPVWKGLFPTTTNHTYDVYVQGNQAYVVDFNLFIIDVSSPQTPESIAQFRTPGWSWDLKIKGNYAYMADDLSGLFIRFLSSIKMVNQLFEKGATEPIFF